MSDRCQLPSVLFVAAAGPGLGFGHLVRAGVLADALGAPRQMVLRGPRSALHTALAFGWTIHRGADLLASLAPDLVVVDDPSPREIQRWLRLATNAGIPAVAIRDGGPALPGADLTVDGSFAARPEDRSDRVAGPAFAILRHSERTSRGGPRARRRVFVALGGGSHVGRLGVAIARAIVQRRLDLRVDLARGFSFQGRTPTLPVRCRWVTASQGLGRHFASAGVAVVAGGVTLYEACAAGTPSVAVPVVAAQWPAIVAAAAAGAVVAVPGRDHDRTARNVATAVEAALDTPGFARQLGRRARRVVDGDGTARVVARIRALLWLAQNGRWHHAA